MEDVRLCNICRSTLLKTFKHSGDYELIRCRECGFVFIPKDTYDSPGSLDEQYVHDLTSTADYYCATRMADIHYARENLSILARFISPGTMLDIGCNVGTFMAAAREAKWSVKGLEPNRRAASIARDAGFEVYEDFFSDEFIEKNVSCYNAIHMGDVIEHVMDPMNFLKRAHKILNPQGLIMITTINIDSFWGRRYQIKPLEHPVYFNKVSLRLAMEKAGYEVLLLKPSSRTRDIENILKSTSKLGVLEKMVSTTARLLHCGPYLSVILRFLIIDEILAIGRRRAVMF